MGNTIGMDSTQENVSSYDRHDDSGTAAPLHGADSFEGDEAGAEGAAVALVAWVSLSAECQMRAGEAGHCDAAV